MLSAANATQRLTLDLETGLRGWQLTDDRIVPGADDPGPAELPAPAARAALARARRSRRRPLACATSRARSADYTGEYLRPALEMRPAVAVGRRAARDGRRGQAPGRRRSAAGSTRSCSTESRLARSARAMRATPRTAPNCSASARSCGAGDARGGVVYLARGVVAPVADAADAATRIAGGDLSARVEARGAGEVAQLGGAFNTMAATLESNQAELERNAEELRRANAELDGANVELGRAYRELETSKEQSILALSTPVLEIDDQTLLLPLIGDVSRERAQQIKQRLLAGVRDHRSRFVVLDVTGVPTLDTHTARVLVEIVEAARLLGASVVLTGVSGELAARARQPRGRAERADDARRPEGRRRVGDALGLRAFVPTRRTALPVPT